MNKNDPTPELDRRAALIEQIRRVDASSFEQTALSVFAYQADYNPVYQQFLELLGVNQRQIGRLSDIPHLPIALFKTQQLQTGQWEPEIVFTSSGTSGQTTSKHLVRSQKWYQEVARLAFTRAYGSLERYAILALLPAYLERQGSSLIFMVDDFMRQSRQSGNGFFLYDQAALLQRIDELRRQRIPTLLIGVSFALLDLAEQHPTDLSDVIIMETGGMKGRRRELTREELHHRLTTAFNSPTIHSEYGMTELLSQAYSPGQGLFYPAPTMRVSTREITDPLAQPPAGKTGALNIQDLANVDTISFIATDDLGRVNEDGSFKILGRLDYSDVRGCNLLIADMLS